MLKKLIIPMILFILAAPLVGGTEDQADRLKSFLRLYCRTYESKDIDKLATFFAFDAIENNKPCLYAYVLKLETSWPPNHAGF